jgi:hypothetical protein
MGQRVGANASQHSKIKKMHAAGTPLMIISKTFNIEPQSLENIIAALDGRKPKTLAIEANPEVQGIIAENADLLARLAKYEELDDGDEAEEEEDEEAEA